MQIEIATLFPEMCEAVLSQSILGRARAKGALTVRCHQIRDYTTDKHNRVDDAPFGGGMGMVMQAQPIFACWQAVQAQSPLPMHTIYMQSCRGCFCSAGIMRASISVCWTASATRRFPSGTMS